MLDGPVSDSVESKSLGLNPQHIHIYSVSWGPEDNGKTVDGPGRLAKQTIFDGIYKVCIKKDRAVVAMMSSVRLGQK